jgi:hypothetical protein
MVRYHTGNLAARGSKCHGCDTKYLTQLPQVATRNAKRAGVGDNLSISRREELQVLHF